MRRRQHERERDTVATQGLGWTSIAIGLSEILMPRQIERAMGIGGNGRHTGVLRALGMREIMHGVDLLSHPHDPEPGVRARLMGDLLDGALLAVAGAKTRRPGSFATVCAMVLGVVAMDVLYARDLHRRKERWFWQR